MTQVDPPRATWNGLPLAVSPRQLQLLHLLCQRGKASHLAVQCVAIGEDAAASAAPVVITQLRRKLPRNCEIRSIKGWGYELIIEGEQSVTTTAQEQPKIPNTIRDLAIAAAGNIRETDQAAVLTVVQADGQVRVTPFMASTPAAIQVLALGSVLLAKTLTAKKVDQPASSEAA